MLCKVNLDCSAQWNKLWNCFRTFVDQKLTWIGAVWYEGVLISPYPDQEGNKIQ